MPLKQAYSSVLRKESHFLQNYFTSCGKFPCLVLLIFRHSDVQSEQVFYLFNFIFRFYRKKRLVSRSEEIHLLLALKGPRFLDLMEGIIGFFTEMIH